MNFIEKLGYLMEKKNIKNINMLSKKSGVPYMTIRNFYEKGYENIKLSTIRKLCDYFDVPMDYLCDDAIQNLLPKEAESNTLILDNEMDKEIIQKFLKLSPRSKFKVEGKIEDYLQEEANSLANTDSVLSAQQLDMIDKKVERYREELISVEKGGQSTASPTSGGDVPKSG